MKNFISILIQSFIEVWRKRWLLWLCYGVLLSISLLITLPFRSMLSQTVGQSLYVGRFIDGMDYNFWIDFSNHFKGSLSAITYHTLLLSLVFVLCLLFLKGGLLSALNQSGQVVSWQHFGKKCRQFFGRMLRLAFYTGLVYGGILFLFWWVLVQFTGGISPYAAENDEVLFSTLLILLAILGMVVILIKVIYDYTSIFMVRQNKRLIYQALIEASKFVLGHWGSVLLLYSSILLLLGLLMWGYWNIYPLIQERTLALILVSLLLSQFVLLLRLGFRLAQWQSIHLLIDQERTLKSDQL